MVETVEVVVVVSTVVIETVSTSVVSTAAGVTPLGPRLITMGVVYKVGWIMHVTVYVNRLVYPSLIMQLKDEPVLCDIE